MAQPTLEQLNDKSVFIISWIATTRALVRSKYDGDKQPIGTIFLSKSGNNSYIKIARANADADRYKITATNAD